MVRLLGFEPSGFAALPHFSLRPSGALTTQVPEEGLGFGRCCFALSPLTWSGSKRFHCSGRAESEGGGEAEPALRTPSSRVCGAAEPVAGGLPPQRERAPPRRASAPRPRTASPEAEQIQENVTALLGSPVRQIGRAHV